MALTFQEALLPSRFLAQVSLAAEAQARRELSHVANAALRPALLAAKFALESGELRVVFEGGIPKGAKLMESVAGGFLPKLVDGRTGKIVKNGRMVSATRSVATGAANASLIVVEVAHLISGYDNAQRLKKVERGVNTLVHAHHSELRSRLEAIYRYAKELLHGGTDQLTPEDRRELHRQCRDLIELRARWRDDFRHRLDGITAAEPGWVNRLLLWRKEKAERKSREQKATEATESLETVQLMHFSLLLQMSLSGAAGRLDPFRAATLPEECRAWEELRDYATRRGAEICRGKDATEFRPFLEAVDGLTRFWLAGTTQMPNKFVSTTSIETALQKASAVNRVGKSTTVRKTQATIKGRKPPLPKRSTRR